MPKTKPKKNIYLINYDMINLKRALHSNEPNEYTIPTLYNILRTE